MKHFQGFYSYAKNTMTEFKEKKNQKSISNQNKNGTSEIELATKALDIPQSPEIFIILQIIFSLKSWLYFLKFMKITDPNEIQVKDQNV